MIVRVGAPRALGGRRCPANLPPDPRRSPSGPWRLHILNGSERRIHDPPVKCSDSSRRPTSILKTAFFKKVINLEAFFLERFCPHRGGHGTLLKCSDSSWRLLWRGPRISKTFPRAPAGTRGGPRKGKKFRARPFDRRASRGAGSLHICNGLCAPVPSHTVNMQRFGPSHGTL